MESSADAAGTGPASRPSHAAPTADPFRTATSPPPSASGFQPTLSSYTRSLPCLPLHGGHPPLLGCGPGRMHTVFWRHLTNIH